MKHFTFSILVLAFLFSAACGKTGAARKTASEDCAAGSCGGDTNGGSDNGFAVKVQKTEGIISQRQLLPNFQACLGIPDSGVSPTTKAAFKEAIPSLSLDGMTKDVNAPLLLAVAKVTSELCLDLVTNVERNSTSRKFFPGFTLSSTASINASQAFDMKKTLTALSNACWGRAITETEMGFITAQMTAGAKDAPAAVFACTVVLSSAEAIRF